jgi:hypothetical protein
MARADGGATPDGILTQPWPPDLDPARVPFRQRTITVLKGTKLWDDMTRIDTITRHDVRGYWVTGPVTVNDLITAATTAVSWHHHQAKDLAAVGERERWTRQVWRRDRRFVDLLPPVDATVYDIAVGGYHDHQRHLQQTLPALRDRLAELSAETADQALVRYVATNTGRTRERTAILLQRLHLLEPAINGNEAARQLGVSPQRIYQLVGQLRNRIEQVQPPGGAGAWLPQWPDAVPYIVTKGDEPANLKRPGAHKRRAGA